MNRRSKRDKNRANQTNIGLPPGSLVFTGEREDRKVKVTRFDYNAERIAECEVDLQSIRRPAESSDVVWYNVDGLWDTTVLERFREVFAIHALVMEDIVHVGADSLVDRYFLLLERLGDTIEKLEENIYESSSDQVVRHIYQIKREASEFRRAVWPLREVINRLERDEGGLIIDDTKTFLRDLYDHTIQIIDTVESYRSLDHPCASPYGTTWQQSVNKGDNSETTRNAP